MSQAKRMRNMKRNGRRPPEKRPATPDDRSAVRRFNPALKNVTEGGSVFGVLVANERAKLGLTQRELAARIHTSPSTVARIEQGHPPGAELRKQLTETLYPEPPSGPMRRFAPTDAMRRFAPTGAARRVAPGVANAEAGRTPKLPRWSLSSRWLWGPLAAAVLVLLIVIAAGRISTDSGASSSAEPSVAVSNALGAPAAIHRARVDAQKAAAAEAKRAAERAREREQAAAAAAAAAAARKAQAKAAHQNTTTVSPPVTQPVTPAPAPSGGGGGGGSSGPAPGLQHGIGNGG